MHTATSHPTDATNATNAGEPRNWPVTVLLDDQTAPAGERRSRLYQGLHEQLPIDGLAALAGALARMQIASESGLHAVMLLDYELGEALQGLPDRPNASPPTSQILLFENVQLLNDTEVDTWLEGQDNRSSVTVTGWRSNVDQTEFAQSVQQIRQRIAKGETYQVNLCFAVQTAVHGSPIALYRALRRHQSVPYGALIGLADGRWVLSRSPELFMRHDNGCIEAQPMKGTASIDSGLDLARDPKNLAENVMIVDLLRNDLGRAAMPGSVSVPERFAVKRYGNVLQMTSTVRAQLRPDVGWAELLQAVFPCGSITGAPKRSTMQIIRELEPDARGLYTGAIGWLEPSKPGQLGKFCVSVPIRTLTLSAPSATDQRIGVLGVGAGITWSSDSTQEWAECALKSNFLHRLVTPIDLFETMRACRSQGIANLELHLARLRASAAELNFTFDENEVVRQLQTTCNELPDDGDYRLRLDLAANGAMTVQTGPLAALQTPVNVLIAPDPMASDDLFLKHKTTNRARYDAAWQQAQNQGAFDMLFFNERDELTEGARSNVFIKLDGHWYTPPLAAGVLPGIMRSILLEDPKLAAREKTISRQELLRAQAVILCNALRGAMPAILMA